MWIISLLITLLLLTLGITFAALNAKPVIINYLIGSSELPLVVILAVSFILGILLSILVMGMSILRLKTKNKWLERKLKRAEEQLLHIPG